MKKMSVAVSVMVILGLLLSVMPVFASADASGTHCGPGYSKVCTPIVEKVCKKWDWWHTTCKEWEDKIVGEKCSCVKDPDPEPTVVPEPDPTPVIPVTGGGPRWEWPCRGASDQEFCVAPEDAEFSMETMKTPPEGMMYLIYTSADKYEWSYTDPAKNPIGLPGIDGWFNNGNNRVYALATIPFSIVDENTLIATPSGANEKAPGMQFVNSKTANPILLVGTFEGQVDWATIEANRWRSAGVAEGQPLRDKLNILSCLGAFLD
jgi:hypothetical protein